MHLLKPNLLLSLKQTVRTRFDVNADKIEFMSFNQDGAVSTLKGNLEFNRPVHIRQYTHRKVMDCYCQVHDNMEMRSHQKNKTGILPNSSQISTIV